MVYKRFSILVILRIIFMLINMVLISNIIFNPDRIFTSIVLGLLLIGQITELLHYINKTNRTLSNFFDTIRDKDFSDSQYIEIVDKSFNQLNQSFKDVARTIFDAKMEKEAQYHLLNLIISKVDTGIILMDEDQRVKLMNDSAKTYFKESTDNSITDIKTANPELYHLIKQKKAVRKVVETSTNPKRQLLVYTSPVKLLNKRYSLITFNDIREEMEIKEVQSWQKLLRTLSHEIMNSVTPISSLSETSLLQIQHESGQLKNLSEIKPRALEKVQKALNTIEKRSSNLYHFVDDFRKLAKIPVPQKSHLFVKELVDSVTHLMKPELSKYNISCKSSVFPDDLEIFADIHQIEQVLINLIINAKDAVRTAKNPEIQIKSKKENHRVYIEIIDNGIGILDEQLEKIFIPFFTTKEEGSGIGLSLSRQIMHLHGGTISVKSIPGIATVFTLQF
ncbi:MAG: ATP-binding protein [Bacteroidales bacterium]|jgi:nitrogen fixation/metabolism regulation signal transduction histidine kinase|nr:ATP-binding protein [Bacteroidales bacterium]